MGDHAPAGPCSLAILARAPVPGRAKTRLVPRLGPEGAAALHALLVERTIRAAAGAGLTSTTVWCAPDRVDPFFHRLASRGPFDLRDQPPGDLGDRMLAAFRAHLALGFPALLVGTDCPELAPGHLRAAWGALHGGAPAVLIPAEDGGYALLGLSRVESCLFDGVPWGTAEVMATTRDRLRHLGWKTVELPAVRDVDRPEDVDWLLGSRLLEGDEQARLEGLAAREA
ncbi:MAG: hypothetical protein RJA59_939 [Pseudomonadota bacterium]